MSEFKSEIVADSLAPCGKRLTTLAITYPRFIHSEIMTHRDRERNAASSRAIPWPKMMAAITESPVIPIRWGSEQKGMQTGAEIDNPAEAERLWLCARDDAVMWAKKLAELGVHKSLVNRITEPWMWITVVMSATEWGNFFRQRCHPDAEIHFQKIAGMIRDSINGSTPVQLNVSEWHLPFFDHDDWTELAAIDDGKRDEMLGGFAIGASSRAIVDEFSCRVSTARIARVSYLTHGDTARDFRKDLALFDRLVNGSGFGHWSPHGHVAQASNEAVRSGPFIGFNQYRKRFANENVNH